MIAPGKFAETDDADTDRMARVRNDDLDAFDELYNRHYPMLVRWISFLMGHPDCAEDLAQQVFLNIFRARHQYVPTAKFTTWMFTITRNAVSNHRRALMRRPVTVTSSQIDEDADWLDRISEPDHDAPGNRLSAFEAHGRTLEAIASLRDRQRTVIELVLVRGHTYQEAAHVMNTTEKAVKSLVNRARCKLRTSLREHAS